MTLDPDDLRGLARACAKRFPSAEAQRRFAAVAGLPGDRTVPGDADAAWEVIFQGADERGSLGKLAAALVKDAPQDETFVALARTLGAATRPERTLASAWIAVGGVGLVLMLGAGWALFANDTPNAGVGVAAKREPGVAAPVAEAPAAAEPAAATEAPAAVAEAAAKAPEPPPVAQVAAEMAAAAPAAAPKSPASAGASHLPVGCTGAPAGEVVGYWYAGEKKPGEQGEMITLDRDARVRVDYPRRENHNNFQTPERCVLPRGTRVKLEQAPIDASKGRWWVPVVGGA